MRCSSAMPPGLGLEPCQAYIYFNIYAFEYPLKRDYSGVVLDFIPGSTKSPFTPVPVVSMQSVLNGLCYDVRTAHRRVQSHLSLRICKILQDRMLIMSFLIILLIIVRSMSVASGVPVIYVLKANEFIHFSHDCDEAFA